METTIEKATLGAGCFWCVEAIFNRVKGVTNVISGYTGGKVKNPTYREVCYGNTGHAEVAQISFDSSIVSFSEILEIFWKTHDPTTLNRQGNDVGTQYRSAIFYENDTQQNIANKMISELAEQKIFDEPIVTTLEPLRDFYQAEQAHQSYYDNNIAQPYCQFIIKPKIEKLNKYFSERVKY